MYDDGSSGDVDKCNDWFLDVTKSYLDEVAKARWFLKQHSVTGQTERVENDASGVFENHVGSHGGLSEELATHLSLPEVEIPIFNGDPREYHMFITTFDQVVGNVGETRASCYNFHSKSIFHKNMQARDFFRRYLVM